MKRTRTTKQMYWVILRAQNNLTIDDVARLSNTSRKTVWRYETGNYKKDTEEIKKIMQFYKQLTKENNHY